jgi:hypothetical protein
LTSSHPFDDAYCVEERRIRSEAAVMWPSFEVYQRDQKAIALITTTQEVGIASPTRLNRNTSESFAVYYEHELNYYVEPPCQDLVRAIHANHWYTTFSNAYAIGPKGVCWVKSIDDWNSQRFHFTFLWDGKTVLYEDNLFGSGKSVDLGDIILPALACMPDLSEKMSKWAAKAPSRADKFDTIIKKLRGWDL